MMKRMLSGFFSSFFEDLSPPATAVRATDAPAKQQNRALLFFIFLFFYFLQQQIEPFNLIRMLGSLVAVFVYIFL